ncbi:glutathione S-transferase family protein [Methylibium petroleiphilum]|uniref:glutathione S-transferase family protein n=1 Tax=Methylibium petroleiphilum TaxID=105560 RepID=UPI001AC12EED|nr:glutathione S-transferase family protein [Methylibium petroleiphilum]MBN9205794.1 glutathione S-transferase family protein [Methylibium petroleiphilum]
MIELHHAPSTAAMAPHILLTEIGVPFVLRPVDTATQAHRSPAYLALNPNGRVPVLADGDLVLYESAAICLHLVDRHPQAALAPPPGSDERAHFYKWLVWLTNTLQATLMVFFYPERWLTDGNDAGAAELKSCAEGRAGALLDLLEAELQRHGGPWLLGARYSAVDAYALMLCRWTRHFAHPARVRPALGAYLQRVLDRPAVRQVFEREGLALPWV